MLAEVSCITLSRQKRGSITTCLLFSNWCYLWLSHVIAQSITMRFLPFRMCISL